MAITAMKKFQKIKLNISKLMLFFKIWPDLIALENKDHFKLSKKVPGNLSEISKSYNWD